MVQSTNQAEVALVCQPSLQTSFNTSLQIYNKQRHNAGEGSRRQYFFHWVEIRKSKKLRNFSNSLKANRFNLMLQTSKTKQKNGGQKC